VTRREIGTKLVKSKIHVKNDYSQTLAPLLPSQLGVSPSGNYIKYTLVSAE